MIYEFLQVKERIFTESWKHKELKPGKNGLLCKLSCCFVDRFAFWRVASVGNMKLQFKSLGALPNKSKS